MTSLLLLLLALTPAQSTTTTATSAQASGALGTWDATFNSTQGPIPAQLTLTKTGDKITGTVSSQMGSAPVEAEVKDKTLSIWFNFQGQSGPVAIEMVGTLDGDKVKGTFTAGGQPGGDWLATRAKDTKDAKDTKEPAKDPAKEPAKATDLTGDWTISLMLETINATPSLTLKQNGEKLTGEYTSQQYGKFPVTGTVTGSDVTFSVSMNIEGNGITAVYTGTVQPDGTMKGSVGLGDAMSGSFSATRKK
jgi:hypothetical protein